MAVRNFIKIESEMKIDQLLSNSAKNGIDVFQTIINRDTSHDKVISNVQIHSLSQTKIDGNLENLRFWKEIDGGDQKAPTNKMPCKYVIEICNHSEHRNQEIIAAYESYKEKNERNVSAAKAHIDLASKYLYVGKVKFGINGRMANHLGYSNKKTGALQLIHWAAQIELSVNIHLFFLPIGSENYLLPLEYHIAQDLKPLLGTHK
jgi:hypothetical protein